MDEIATRSLAPEEISKCGWVVRLSREEMSLLGKEHMGEFIKIFAIMLLWFALVVHPYHRQTE